MPISFEVTGDRQVLLKFEEFPRQAHDALLRHIRTLTAELLSRVEASEPERSGKLKRDTGSVIYDGAEDIVGRVKIGAGFGKAAALEYGAHGTAKVRQHTARLSHVFNLAVAPMAVVVAAHARHLDLTDHRFLRNPLASMEAEILEGLTQALTEAVDEPA